MKKIKINKNLLDRNDNKKYRISFRRMIFALLFFIIILFIIVFINGLIVHRGL